MGRCKQKPPIITLFALVKKLLTLLLSLSCFNLVGQFLPTEIYDVELYNGTFLFEGKLGSYHVKEKFGPEVTNLRKWIAVTSDSTLKIVRRDSVSQSVIRLTMPIEKGTRFFGGGEQFSHVELTGKKVPFLVEENGIGRGDQPATRTANIVGAGGHEWTTYCPIPLLIGTNGYAYLIENDCYSKIDLTVDGEITFIVHDKQLKLRVFEANSPKQLLEKITAVTGRMPQLPDWTYGTILGIQGGAKRVKQCRFW